MLQSAFHLSKFTGQPILIINVMHKAKDMVFQQNLLEKACFIAKMSGAAMVFTASFDVWKVPSVKDAHHPPPQTFFEHFYFFFFFFGKAANAPQSGQVVHSKSPWLGFKKVCKCPTLKQHQNCIFQ